MYVALQANGEQLRYEAWVVRLWQYGQLKDPMLLRGLNSAIEIYQPWGS